MSKVITDNIEDIAGSNSVPTNKLVNRDAVIGFDQTWQDVTTSRSLGVTYTNSTGKPIQISVDVIYSNQDITLTVNGTAIAILGNDGSGHVVFTHIIPNGATYLISSGTKSKWWELR